MPTDDQQDQEHQVQPGSDNLPKMPRFLKYAWGVGVTVLLSLSLVLDQGSAWLPLVHRAIDLLQNQTAPTESK